MGLASKRTAAPYVAVEKSGYFVCVDSRDGQPVSYPATKSKARAEARLMNVAWSDAMAELARPEQSPYSRAVHGALTPAA
jgi:hypothetical protein